MSDELDALVFDFKKFDESLLDTLKQSEVQYGNLKAENSDFTVAIVNGELVSVKIPGQMKKVRDDQVKNNAGGYVFQVSDVTRIRRFLILGSEGGTFYPSEKEITLDNVQNLIRIIDEGKAFMILKEIGEINAQNRNPKMTSMLFALALCARYHVHDCRKASKSSDPMVVAYSKYISEMHKAAFKLVPDVCRIPTHLFEFVGNCELISKSSSSNKDKPATGWGRTMRAVISKWYESKTPERLAMFLTKYPQRGGWSHRDLFRLAHPNLKRRGDSFYSSPERLELETIFNFAVKGTLEVKKQDTGEEKKSDGDTEEAEIKEKHTPEQLEHAKNSKALGLIEAYLKLKNEKNEEIIIAEIKKHGLVREHIPTDALKSVNIWKALLDTEMPMTAMIRNLGRMSAIKCLDDNQIADIVRRLNDVEELRKARIHPLNVLIARSTYYIGGGYKSSLEWEPEQKIVDALEQAFYKSFINAPPTGKRYCLGIDVSGSMGCHVSGCVITCREAASALSLINLHNENTVRMVAFCDDLVELPFDKTWSLDKMRDYMDTLRYAPTDCALPMIWAMEKDLKFDVFVIYTDNETYFGDVHPFEALKQYREKSGIHDARLIVMGMSATEFTIADPTDAGMLDIAGFDSAVPQIISDPATISLPRCTVSVAIVNGELVSDKIPGQVKKVRDDQVKNNAGGYVFQVSDVTRIRRFLILGSEGGTFYQSEKEITLDNVQNLIRIIDEGKAFMILKEIGEINAQNRNPKMTSMLFALALCARYHVHDCRKASKSSDPMVVAYSKYISEMHKAAFKLVPDVCRIPTHLFEFVGNCELISKSSSSNKDKSSTGWGRTMRAVISKWYESKTPERLAMFLTKYPQRGGWSHRDLFRLAHPNLKRRGDSFYSSPERLELETIFNFAVKGTLEVKKQDTGEEKKSDGDTEEAEIKEKHTPEQLEHAKNSKALGLIEAYLKLKNEKNEEIIIAEIKKHGLVREHIPTDALKSVNIWKELLDTEMPMTAMIRNLGRMSAIKCLDENQITDIVRRLNDVEELRKARIHPLNVLIARSTYSKGGGYKSSLQWEPEKRIVDALEKAFYKSFINAPPTGKRYCLGIDVSISMSQPASGAVITCREAASALSFIHFHNEETVKIVAFCNKLTELHFDKKNCTLDTMSCTIRRLRYGSTDCALPMIWAMEKDLKFDVFVIYTDNETFFGDVHPFEALKQYREKSGIHDARLIVMGMSATEFTIADPTDAGMLDIAGFDSAVPQIINEFVNGNI
ncbi:unnamed protein product [Caenorhabditis bovis]|uniref:TROVE domain-containing protein n=1 Tax=Caenorhabditis bovis TaxID=2654633 RepID=A0A8S1ED09_9PELO|nr:unnamed protein product [Caenorhabditis bovis]